MINESDNKKYFYHYCAATIRRDGGWSFLDGIIANDIPIDNDEEYVKIKNEIGEE